MSAKQMAAERDQSSDSGFSLVELAVYVVVLGLISVVLVAVVLSLFRSEQTISAISSSSNDSQVVLTQLTSDIRDARQFASTGDELVASIPSDDAAQPAPWQCVRWIADHGTEALTRQVRPDSLSSDWGNRVDFASEITPIGGEPYFSGDATATATGTLQYAIGIEGAGGHSNALNGQVSNRAPGGADSTCFG